MATLAEKIAEIKILIGQINAQINNEEFDKQEFNGMVIKMETLVAEIAGEKLDNNLKQEIISIYASIESFVNEAKKIQYSNKDKMTDFLTKVRALQGYGR